MHIFMKTINKDKYQKKIKLSDKCADLFEI